MKRTNLLLGAVLASVALGCPPENGSESVGPRRAGDEPSEPSEEGGESELAGDGPDGPADGGDRSRAAAGDAADAGADGGPGPDRSSPTSPGCGKAGAATGLATRTTTVRGAKRSYLVFVPPTYAPEEPLSLVFAFHGGGSNGEEGRGKLGLEAEADGKAIFVYPTALPSQDPEYLGIRRWDLRRDSVDFAFFDTMVAEIEATHCIDRKRIFASGFSMGARMTALLGCYRGNVLRAIAPASPGGSEGDLTGCVGDVAAWITFGSEDDPAKIASGRGIRDAYVKANGCASSSAPTAPAPCVAYDDCKPGLPVHWCLHTGGHVYPTERAPYARQATWSFFAKLK